MDFCVDGPVRRENHRVDELHEVASLQQRVDVVIDRADYKKAIIALNQALCLDGSHRNGSNAA